MYRSVLLKCRTRRKSGESDSSKNGTSGQSSPVTVENIEKSKCPDFTLRLASQKMSGFKMYLLTLQISHAI